MAGRGRLYGALGALGVLGALLLLRSPYPPDDTPEGAYLRLAKAVTEDHPEDCFPYLETAAQHAAFTAQGYRARARARVLESYPEPERTRLAAELEAPALAAGGPGLFALEARRRGLLGLLRRDLSGVARVERAGERATVETARGTRYAFRRRENGIWGLTLFTAVLLAEAERAARDAGRIEAAAADYDRSRGAVTQPEGRPR